MNFTSSVYSFFARHSYLLPLGIVSLTLATLALTLMPTDAMIESKLWSYDKLGHMVLFGSWSFTLGLYFEIRKSVSVNLWIVFASGSVFGLLIEILQHVLPLQRQGDPVDFLFDILGCLAAIWLLKQIIPDKSANPFPSN